MIGGGSSAGTQLNRMMDHLGFPDKLGDIYGAALDAAVGNDAGVARNLMDAFTPLSTTKLDRLLSGGLARPGFVGRPHVHFDRALPFASQFYAPSQTHAGAYQNRMQAHLSSLLQRSFPPLALQSALQNLAGSAGAALQPSLAFAENLTNLLPALAQQIQGQLSGKLQNVAAAGVGKAKKSRKKGKKGLKKVGKKLSKRLKSGVKKIGKFAKSALKNTLKGVKLSLTGVVKGLLSGNFLQMGTSLLGGIVGGPVGGMMIGQMMKAAGKIKPLAKAMGEVNKMLDQVSRIQNNMTELQKLQRFTSLRL